MCVFCFVFMKWERPKPLVSYPAHSRYSIHIVIKEKEKGGERGREKGGRWREGGKVFEGSVERLLQSWCHRRYRRKNK